MGYIVVNIELERFCVVHMFPKSTQLLWGIYIANIELERFCVVRSLKVLNSYGVSLIWEISQN